MDIYYQVVTVSVTHRGRLWYFSAVYACPYLCGRQQLWNYLASLRTHIDGLWLLMGDFNEIVFPSEVKGGLFSLNSTDKFSEIIEKCRLIDLGATGSLYTWYRKESGVLKIAKRLDQAFGDSTWRTLFPEAYVENLLRSYSDHRPILLRGQGSIPPFRFQACWLTDDDYPTIVNNAWKNGEPYIAASLNRVRDDSLTFNKEVFGNIFKRKKDIEKQLQHVWKMIERVDYIHLNMEEANLQKMYQEVLKQEELLWYQKSIEKWVKFGDMNNKFFHTQTIIRRKRNKIQGLHLDDGTWCTNVMQRRDVAIDFYSKLFSE